MGDLDHAVVAGEQAVLGEPREHGGAHGVAIGVELGDGDATADRRFALALADQAKEHPLRRLALWRGELLVGGLGEARDGAADPARSLVSLESQPVVVSRLPELDQGGGEQRQPAGLGLDLRHEDTAQVRLDPDADAPGRQLDRPVKLVARQRADEHQVRREQPRELGMAGDVPGVVGADRDDDDRVGRDRPPPRPAGR